MASCVCGEHDFYVKITPRRKSGDAVARTSVAPVRLHRLIRHEGIKTLRIFAASEGDWGGESYCNIGIWEIWAHLAKLLTAQGKINFWRRQQDHKTSCGEKKG